MFKTKEEKKPRLFMNIKNMDINKNMDIKYVSMSFIKEPNTNVKHKLIKSIISKKDMNDLNL